MGCLSRRVFLRIVAAGSIGLVPMVADAMAMVEFMELTSVRQHDIVKPLLIGFLKAGYKSIPDNEFTLISEMKKLAFAKGYTYQSVDEVAKEAAINLGMKRAF